MQLIDSEGTISVAAVLQRSNIQIVRVQIPLYRGKSTLMNIIGCLVRVASAQAESGLYLLNGTNLTTLDDDELADIRNRYIGFVFQQFNLLPRLTALGNVMLPTIYADVSRTQRVIQMVDGVIVENAHNFLKLSL